LLPSLQASRTGGASPIEQVIVVDGPADGALEWSDVMARANHDFDFDGAWRAVLLVLDARQHRCRIFSHSRGGEKKNAAAPWQRRVISRVRQQVTSVRAPRK